METTHETRSDWLACFIDAVRPRWHDTCVPAMKNTITTVAMIVMAELIGVCVGYAAALLNISF